MTLKTSDLCDACADAQACALAFRGWGRRRAFAGIIRTLRVHEDIAVMRDMVGREGHGQVLVIDGGGSLNRALFGDVMAGVAMRNGWAGLIIHGALRDGVEIDAMDIGVKALGTVPKRGERTGAGEVDVPVSFGGITFTPGQRVVADDDGVIVLPPGLTEQDIQTDDVVAATAAYAASAGTAR